MLLLLLLLEGDGNGYNAEATSALKSIGWVPRSGGRALQEVRFDVFFSAYVLYFSVCSFEKKRRSDRCKIHCLGRIRVHTRHLRLIVIEGGGSFVSEKKKSEEKNKTMKREAGQKARMFVCRTFCEGCARATFFVEPALKSQQHTSKGCVFLEHASSHTKKMKRRGRDALGRRRNPLPPKLVLFSLPLSGNCFYLKFIVPVDAF